MKDCFVGTPNYADACATLALDYRELMLQSLVAHWSTDMPAEVKKEIRTGNRARSLHRHCRLLEALG